MEQKDNRTPEQISKEEAEKLYPVITTHNWYAKENAAYRNGFERAFEIASQQTAALREENNQLKELLSQTEAVEHKTALILKSQTIDMLKNELQSLRKENERLKDLQREVSIDFFYWWHNQPGTNIEAGFRDYIETERYKALTSNKE